MKHCTERHTAHVLTTRWQCMLRAEPGCSYLLNVRYQQLKTDTTIISVTLSEDDEYRTDLMADSQPVSLRDCFQFNSENKESSIESYCAVCLLCCVRLQDSFVFQDGHCVPSGDRGLLLSCSYSRAL